MDIVTYIKENVTRLGQKIDTLFYRQTEIDTKLDNITIDTSELLDKSTYASETNEGSIKMADEAKKIEGIEESTLFSVYGKSPSGVEGFYEFPIGVIDENTNKFQSVRQNAIANEVYTVELINENKKNDLIVQCYEFIPGEQDLVTTLREFNNTDKDNFYYNTENIEFDNGMQIKNNYKLNNTQNDDKFYESELINKNDFLNIIEIKLGGK